MTMNRLNKNFFKHASHQQGVTLLELMVAMAVSSVIMLGISNIYLSTKKSYIIHDEFSRIQENGRYSIETLSTNIRNAGFFGCSSGQLGAASNSLRNPEQSANNFQTGLMGYEALGTDFNSGVTTITPNIGVPGDWATALGLTAPNPAGGVDLNIAVTPEAAITNLAVKGSDILIIRTADNSGVRVDRNNQGAQFFAVNPTGEAADANGCVAGICNEDILLVSDCTKSLIFQATNVVANQGGGGGNCNAVAPADCFNLVHSGNNNIVPGNVAPNWNDGTKDFGPDSEIMTVVTKTYFIGVNPAQGVTEPSLYVRENNNAPQPLVEGIENMQILYGIDTNITPGNPAGDGIANRYVSANRVTNLDNESNTVFESVVSVKISLLARTPQDLPGINRTAADYAALTYNMVSPASPILINPFTPGVPDRRMRKIFNITIKIRNKSFNLAN